VCSKDSGGVLAVNTVELFQSEGHISRLISLATMMHADRYYLPAIILKTHASSGYKS
jgi:hypothetical protein